LLGFLAPPEAPDEVGRLGPYRVRRVLGTGGMGVVFHAEDPQLARPVALKAMLPALAVSADARQRFLREARAAAAISHDHVVPVFAVGEDRGVPFLAMPLLEGESLEERLHREEVLSPTEVLRIGREIAAGLAAAHERGLVHRDVKPANVWLEGSQRRVKILDFGLARAAAAGPQLTREGAIIGTPAFMSPEQVNGRPVDARGDLFSLGCVLYQMATGSQPFAAPDTTSTLLAVSHCRPRPPDEVRPGLPPTLSALILQLLAKDPDDRPASAGAVIEMIAAIEADPSLRPERLGLRKRRRRRGAVMAALVLAGGAAAALYAFRPGGGTVVLPTDDAGVEIVVRRDGRIVRVHDSRSGETWDLNALHYHIETADGPDGLLLDRPDKEVLVLRRRGGSVSVERLLEPPPGAPPDAQDLARRASPLDSWKELAPAAFPEGKLSGSPAKLVGLFGDWRFRFRGMPSFPALSADGRHLALATGNDVLLFDRPSGALKRTLRGHRAFAFRPVFAPDGKTLASAGGDATVRLWDVESGRPVRTVVGHAGIVTGLAFRPDGAAAASIDGSNRVLIWDVDTGQIRHRLAGHKNTVYTVAFRPPDGRQVASAGVDGMVRLWDAATGEALHAFPIEPWYRFHLAFSPDGRLLMAGTDGRLNEKGINGTAKVWDVDARRELAVLHTPACWAAFTPDGQHLLTTQHKRPDPAATPVLKRWDVHSWQEVGSFPLPGQGDWFFHALSPDGGTLAVAPNADTVVRLFDLPSGEQICPTSGHAGESVKVAFSPDGKTLASAAKDGTVRLWDLADGRQTRVLTGHAGEIRSVAFSPGRRLLGSSSADGTVRVWNVATGKAVRTFVGHAGLVEQVLFSPDGKLLASAGRDGTVRLWNLMGKEPRILRAHANAAIGLAFSRDGSRLASAGYDNRAVVWDVAAGVERHTLQHTSTLNAVVFLDEDRVLAGTGGDGKVALWDVQSGARLRMLTGPTTVMHGLAARGDGRRLAGGGLDGTVHLWDLALPLWAPNPGRLAVPLYPSGNWVSGVAFSPEGRHLAATTPEGLVAIFRLPEQLPPDQPSEAAMKEAKAPGELRRFTGHAGPVHWVAFSPNAKLAASASGNLQGDQTVRLWEVASGRQLRCLVGHTGQAMSVVFSPDGRRLLSAGWDRTVRLWDVETGQELRCFAPHDDAVNSVAFCPDGRRGISASTDGTLRLWDLGSGTEIRRFVRHSGTVREVAVSPDGRRALSAGYDDRTVRLWDVETGREVRCLRGHADGVNCVQFSPDGRLALSAGRDGDLRLWDVDAGKMLRRLVGHQSNVQCVAFAPEGRRAISAGGADHTLRLWDVATGRELRRITASREWVYAAAFAPDGRSALSGGGGWQAGDFVPGTDWALHLWRLPDPGEKVAPLPPVPPPPNLPALLPGQGRRLWWPGVHVYAVATAPDGRSFLAGGDDATVRLYDLKTGTCVQQFVGHRGYVNALAYVPSRRVLSASDDGTVRVWDAETGEEVRVLEGHAGPVYHLDISADGKQALSAGADRTLRLWDLATGREVGKLQGHEKTCAGLFVPGTRRVVSWGGDGTLGQWDVPSGKELVDRRMTLEGPNSARLLPGGRRLAVGGTDCVRIIDLDARKEVRRVKLPGGPLHGWDVSPDGRRVLVWVGEEFGVRLLDVESGRELAGMRTPQRPTPGIRLTPDGKHAVIGCFRGEALLLRLPDPEPAEPTGAGDKQKP
jgi:WD40 repeat protein